jgi:ubiquinone/menaquinone biosynthesis C-methylase UbiE
MSYISRNKQSFGVVAKEYKKFRGSYNSDLYKAIFSLVKNDKSKVVSILDLGCGVGNSTEPLIKMARKLGIKASVVGCDPDVKMLREAKKSAKKNNLPIEYISGSAEKLPFESQKFDLVTSGLAFHWFATRKAMKEVRRTIKKKGVYLIFWIQYVKTKQGPIGQELFKKYKYKGIPSKLRDPKNVKKIFTNAGFSKVRTLKIPFVEKKTIEEMIGLQKTNSTYALLLSEDRKKFIIEMTNEYKKSLGKSKLVLSQEINICYGIN